MQAHILKGETAIFDALAGGPAAGEGLAIYARAYPARLLEALANIYPGLHAMAGDATLLRFVEAQPPREANLRWYGEAMASWLRGLQPAPPAEWAAMAELEWALAMVFEAGDASPVTRADLAVFAAEDWPWLVLRPVPAWRCLSLPAGLVALRHRLLQGRGPGRLPDRAVPAGDWVLWRQSLDVQQRSLQAEEAVLVAGLREGAHLAGLCERLAVIRPPGEVAARLMGWIELWLEQRWIAAIEVGTAGSGG